MDVICKNANICPLAIKKEGKKVKQESCTHMTPHEQNDGCKLTICGRMAPMPCGCIPYVEPKKEERSLSNSMLSSVPSPVKAAIVAALACSLMIE